MMWRFLAAVQFLTLIPVRVTRAVSLGDAVFFFPIVGALLGATGGGVLILTRVHLGSSIAGILAVACCLLLTGGLHEDGLADVADAFRSGRSRETILQILKDSRIGTYGALALIVSLLLRWQALCRISVSPIIGLAAAMALSRTALVVLAAAAPSAGGGLGASFIKYLSPRMAVAAVACGLAISITAMPRQGLLMAVATGLVILLARSYFMRRLGGVNGDCLGASCQLAETINLLILAWQPSI